MSQWLLGWPDIALVCLLFCFDACKIPLVAHPFCFVCAKGWCWVCVCYLLSTLGDVLFVCCCVVLLSLFLFFVFSRMVVGSI